MIRRIHARLCSLHTPKVCYRDAVLIVDEFSLYARLVGRQTKKDPHLLLQNECEAFMGRWGVLKNIKVDDEFVTKDTLQYARSEGYKVYQAPPPGDHSMVQGRMESVVGWIGDGAQANMNRLDQLVLDGVINDLQ